MRRRGERPATTKKIRKGLLLGLAAVAFLRQMRKVKPVARQYRVPLLYVPLPSSAYLLLLRLLTPAKRFLRQPELPNGVVCRVHYASSADADVKVKLFAFERSSRQPNSPVFLWIHGGGLVGGSAVEDASMLAQVAKELDAFVVSVEYRLAPKYPFPAALDDCYTALRWLAEKSEALGVDPRRIAIGGASAGGGLCAALAQRAKDQGNTRPVFQVLVYPMLDDRTTLRKENDGRGQLIWTPFQNRYGWTSYLGHKPSWKDERTYAAAARRQDLAGLPPAWIGVGTLDLFFDEDVEYAQRLENVGISCELEIVQDVYHGFNVLARNAPGSLNFVRRMLDALQRAVKKDDESICP